MVSPFGKHAQIVAVFVALAIVLGHVGFLALTTLLNGSATSPLDEAFWIALGAIFGSFATVNGVKGDIQAAHKRLDTLEAPPAGEAYDG